MGAKRSALSLRAWLTDANAPQIDVRPASANEVVAANERPLEGAAEVKLFRVVVALALALLAGASASGAKGRRLAPACHAGQLRPTVTGRDEDPVFDRKSRQIDAPMRLARRTHFRRHPRASRGASLRPFEREVDTETRALPSSTRRFCPRVWVLRAVRAGNSGGGRKAFSARGPDGMQRKPDLGRCALGGRLRRSPRTAATSGCVPTSSAVASISFGHRDRLRFFRQLLR
jgi:hypothetical protein